MSSINITYLEKIIHEMNTPLQNLGMIPDLMLDPAVAMNEEDKRESLHYIQNSAHKLIKLVSMLSSITNISSDNIKLNTEKADIVDLVNKEIDYHTQRLKRDKSKEIKLSFKSEMKNCIMQVDSFWFGQLIANLIINAINHMDNGTVLIETSMVKEEAADYLNLNVSDEGCGIPDDELETIFTPLQRGSHSIGKVNGSGIGLAVAKEVIESHGGTIEARNNSQGGATFNVSMPIVT